MLDEQSVGLLKELHLLTRDGKLNADARRKLKQVNHLYGLLSPALTDLWTRHESVSLVDVGAGKAYLGFILYELSFKMRTTGTITSIETRPELVQQAQATAQRLGFERMQFFSGAINDFASPAPFHLLTALHACDTATDDALVAGIRAAAEYIAVIPCCQAEVAEQLRHIKSTDVVELWRHGMHRREFGSHLTNVLRCLVLESYGYAVTVTELVGWEHSLKNELILARRVQKTNPMAARKLQALLQAVPVMPQLIERLRQDATIPAIF